MSEAISIPLKVRERGQALADRPRLSVSSTSRGTSSPSVSCRPGSASSQPFRAVSRARKLRKRFAANRAHPFVFITNRDVPYANNVCERHLRSSVIFRKVTNGFRCEWGAETYAAFHSLVSTAKANRPSVLEVLRFVLATRVLEPLPTRPG